MMNTYLKVIIVGPLTIKVRPFKGNLVLDPTSNNGLKEQSEVLIFHMRSISKECFVERLGKVDTNEVEKVKGGIEDILRY